MQVIDNFLTGEECQNYIRLTDENIPDQDSDEKLPDYYMFKSKEIQDELWAKLKDRYELPDYVDWYGDVFTPCGISQHLTILRYRKGYKMGKHVDSPYDLGPRHNGPASLVIYLNTIDPEYGGVTCFTDPETKVHAEEGRALIFMNKDREHYVTELTEGVRYVMSLVVKYRVQSHKDIHLRDRIFDLKTKVNSLDDSDRDFESWKDKMDQQRRCEIFYRTKRITIGD